jgi:hypothetical protein
MNKILLGLSILLSVVLLSGCGSGSSGSSGSDGAAGSAGATGATGASGSISLFEDADMLASFNGAAGAVAGSTPTVVPLDSGGYIGGISGTLGTTGIDNLTADSRNRYYMYAKTSAGVKHRLCGTICGQTGATTEAGENSIYRADNSDGIFDARLIAGSTIVNVLDNYSTVAMDLTNVAGTTFNSGGSFTICPGNEAGDGSCTNVLAPVYDRGAHVRSPMLHTDTTSSFLDANASITYNGTAFKIVSDNSTYTGSNSLSGKTGVIRAMVFTVSDNKSNFALAQTGDNSSSIHPVSVGINDNGTIVSNIITRTAGAHGVISVFAMGSDNITPSAAGTFAAGLVNSTPTGTLEDNGTFIGDHKGIQRVEAAKGVTRMQIADSGDGVYILTGRSTALTANLVFDNGTVTLLGTDTQSSAATILADAWCSTSTGTAKEYALVMSDNHTTATGWVATKVYDNGTIEKMTYQAADRQVNSEVCAVTHLGGTFYLAVNDETGGDDNVSVFKSTDTVTWSQIGIDLDVDGDVSSIAITTNGSTVSDNAVWVAANVGGEVQLLHYEDIAGGTSYAWRSVGVIIGNAGTSGVSVAADGGTVIAASAIVSGETAVGFWYDQ